jgi:hypothetical protein
MVQIYCFSPLITDFFRVETAKMVTKLLTVWLLSLISPNFCGNVGIGFSTSGPYDVPLGQMKSKNVYILKTWDIQADLLNQMEITYAQVFPLKILSSTLH